ncbi:site-specific integrase [Vibrio sp. S17_S38]|uniref:tyrosine-type recombinase/integrase n=1 Tax=Vibrio sp. S17_S38 TaxID=2720229 RepID=UPI00167FFCA1|nr:site-specific integrase [Vibrio sp. S17_S38]MBD1572873.1 site-specific integrase [Vibrio sp. S17_S38]
MQAIRLNQNVFFNSTVTVRMSEAQIRKHIDDRRVSELKDARCSLYLRFNSNRTGGTWWLRRYKNGSEMKVRIGQYPTTQAKDVMSLVSAATITIEKGDAVECSKFETVDQLIDWHVKRESSSKLSSRERLNNLRSMADRHLIGMFHGVSVMKVDHALIDADLIKPMFAQGYSVAYVRAIFNLLKTAFNTAHKLKHITLNVIADVRFKSFFNDNFSLTRAQLKGCRVNADQLPGILQMTKQARFPVRMLIMMILGHGSRIGETRKAKWSDISFMMKRWTIPKSETKNGEEMVYPLSAWMVEQLHSYQAWQVESGYVGDWVFPVSKKGNKAVYASLASQWVQEVAQGLWSAHDLRKRARSIWLDIGVDYIVCEALLNHARDKLDQAYIHTHMELQKKQAIETYHEWLKIHW